MSAGPGRFAVSVVVPEVMVWLLGGPLLGLALAETKKYPVIAVTIGVRNV